MWTARTVILRRVDPGFAGGSAGWFTRLSTPSAEVCCSRATSRWQLSFASGRGHRAPPNQALHRTRPATAVLGVRSPPHAGGPVGLVLRGLRDISVAPTCYYHDCRV